MITSVTICICTHNRAGLLSLVLDSLAMLQVPRTVATDVLIVDNASQDNTRDVAYRYVAKNRALFKYVFEKNLGLSHARNRGLRESTSDVIAYLDDDAVPRNGWLEGLLAGYAGGDAVGAVGGQILLAIPPTSVPRWFTKQLHPYFSEKEIAGNDMLDCAHMVDYPYGANISFRRGLALQMGGFDTNLGRTGSRMLSGEETLLCKKIQRAGYRILVNPASVVDHHIPASRISLGVLYRQAWNEGKCFVLCFEERSMPVGTLSLLLRLPYVFMMHSAEFLKNGLSLANSIERGYRLIFDVSILLHRWKSTSQKDQ